MSKKEIPPHIRISVIERHDVSLICDGCGAVSNFGTDDSESARKGKGKFVAEHNKCRGKNEHQPTD